MKFRTVESALRWAYEERTKPILNTVKLSDEPACSSSKDPCVPIERHMMSEDILKRTIKSLDLYEWAFVCFMFGYNSQWAASVLTTHHLLNAGVSLRGARAADLLIRGYRGDKKSGGLRELRKCLGTGMLKTVATRNRVYDHLDCVYARVIDKLHRPLEGYLDECIR